MHDPIEKNDAQAPKALPKLPERARHDKIDEVMLLK
jgi:hypothetical protein